MLTRFTVVVMQWLGHLPLAWLRAVGWLLGVTLYALVVPRRRVAWINLQLCFPQWSKKQVRAVAIKTFVHFAQAWLDRGWLWHGAPELTLRRLRLTGALAELQGTEPVIIFAPHFVGLDAGWTALTQQLPRVFTTIYTHQANPQVDAWVFEGRRRFGEPQLCDRSDGPKPIITALRAGRPVYLLPDMNYGLPESVFVPFYGVPTLTVTSLGRLAKLGRAKVVPVVTRMTKAGYDVQVMPAWHDFPVDDQQADAAQMNLRLQAVIDTMPDQYFWVHKRFKDRPAGEPGVY
jgi:KDO2-lipid IV(A) lauroyltransferase